MHRHINQLSQVFQKMKGRYGSNDPVVLQLREAIEKSQAIDSLPPDATLPFGERRTARTKPSYWNVKLRHAHQPLSRQDVLAECKRVEHRALGL